MESLNEGKWIEVNGFCCLTDEFNRVIIPVKRGEENTDYVNASFIDVSDRADDLTRLHTEVFRSSFSFSSTFFILLL